MGERENGGPRRVRLGMVGGGQGAFIGAVHRIAARIDDHFELVAGAFASDPEKGRAFAKTIGIAAERAYGTYEEMVAKESCHDDRVEAVSIVTPNFLHFPIAKAFLGAGFHVICEKPMTTSLADAKKLVELVEKAGKIFVLTHNYTGYPMVRHARELVRSGELGEIRVVQVEYSQDWLSRDLESTGHMQAVWRSDPARAGAGGSIGDIGTHAYNLACFVTGLKPESLLADLATFVKGRRVDDNAHVLLRFEGGARGMLWASQVASGRENALRLQVYGANGGLEWAQEDPNYLWHGPLGDPKSLITRSGAGAGDAAGRVTRIPAGHPEGFLECFANIYAEAARAIRAAHEGRRPDDYVIFPTVYDGVAGVAFIEACVKSSRENGAWVKL